MLCSVTTKYGKLRGVPTVAENIAEFRGIPYAQAPVGDWRWRAPREPLPWTGERDCGRYAPGCWQPERPVSSFYRKEFYTHRFHKYPLPWSEDCLYLNVWTPAETAEDRLPVLVWIHGGGYTHGYSHESRSNGEVLAGGGLVVVSLNYRLNIFGFFAHPALAEEQNGHCGNYALMDQAAALKWIHENIAAFGGDPENITIYGQSAGSYSVQCLSVMEMAKGTFRRAIMQSGTALSLQHFSRLYKPQKEAESIGLRFMEFAGKKTLKELREIPADELLRLYVSFRGSTGININTFCEDGYVFTDNPGHKFLRGDCHIDGLIAGSTEWETQLTPGIAGVTKENYAEKVREKINAGDQLMAQIRVMDDEDASRTIRSWFAYDLLNTAPVLCGRLGMDGKNGYWYNFQREVPGADRPGTFHSADIWYAFGNLYKRERPWTDDDYAISRLMNRYWINFAKTGDPNGDGLPRWDPCTIKNVKGMAFDAGKNVMTDLFAERDENFDGLYRALCRSFLSFPLSQGREEV